MDLSALSESDETNLIVGFFDVKGYLKWCEGRPAREIFHMVDELVENSQALIEQAGGYFIKSIGDSGLFIFPADDPNQIVTDILDLKHKMDVWLSERDYPEVMSVKLQMGPVACGQIGPANDKRFDIIGETVNRAAMMKGWPFSISSEFEAALSSENLEHFHRIHKSVLVTDF